YVRSMTDLSSTLTNGGASTRTRRTSFGSSILAYTAKLASTIAPVQTVPSGSQSGEGVPTWRVFAAAFFAGGASSMLGTANVAGTTLPCFHAGNDTMTFALP